jgi:SH3 domain protein
MTKIASLCLAISSGFIAGIAAAETVYVTDKLRLGVHAAADTSDRAFTNLDSGDAMEVLERRGSYARVRLEDGREGWVRTVFLVSEEPARRRLSKLETERDALARKLTELAASTDKSGDQLSQLQTAAAKARQGQRVAESQLAIARRENQELRDQLSPDQLTLSLFIGLGAGLGLLLLGFLLAWWWFDRRSRQRHGGLRVY